MIVAYKILDQILKEDFGFENILYAFSGRRGIHAWLCDERARKLKDDGRIAIANYIKYKISNIKMEINQGLKDPVHPLYERAIKIIDEYFNDVLNEQNLLNDEKGKNLLKGLIKAYFGNNSQEDKIDKILNSQNNNISTIKLDEIIEYLNNINQNKKVNSKKGNSLVDLCIKDFKLNILYPRLDINVSTHINHLLKSPFCIHPKTGLVAVPLSHEDILNFKIDDIPRLDKLIDDFNNHRKNGCFEKYIEYFQEFVKKLNSKK
jgi:DNA primase small subunit